jgi:fucose permease
MTAERRPGISRPEATAYMGLFCVGLYVTSFGPALPFIAAENDVGLGTAGLVLTALSGGSISASAAVSLRLGRIDASVLTAIGLIVCAGGLSLLSLSSSLPLTLFACVGAGIGDGLIVASTHSLVTVASDDVPRGINRLNIMFAIGAILGPLWTGFALELTHDLELAYLGLAAFLIFAAAMAWQTPRTGSPGEEHLVVRLNPAVVLMGLILFFYVGGEFGLGAWVSSYTEQAAEASVIAGAAVASGYWGALALGRFATGWLLASHAPTPLLGASISLAGAAGVALVVIGDVLLLAFAAAFITGLAFGPIWPLAMAIGTRDAGGSTTAALVTAGNSGALFFPAAQGAILAGAGPQEGVAVTPALCFVMIALLIAHTRAERRTPVTIEA